MLGGSGWALPSSDRMVSSLTKWLLVQATPGLAIYKQWTTVCPGYTRQLWCTNVSKCSVHLCTMIMQNGWADWEEAVKWYQQQSEQMARAFNGHIISYKLLQTRSIHRRKNMKNQPWMIRWGTAPALLFEFLFQSPLLLLLAPLLDLRFLPRRGPDTIENGSWICFDIHK